jgi:hypothetical protein
MEPYRFCNNVSFSIAGDNVPERFWFFRDLQTENAENNHA